MASFKMLVLTDHSNHSSENSLYPLARAMRRHESCAEIDVATRGDSLNYFFFQNLKNKELFVRPIDQQFAYHKDGRFFKGFLKRVALEYYDVVWLRMPPPLSLDFLNFLSQTYPKTFFINDPMGIHQTGSKAFLINFKNLCPPMQVCRSVKDILDFKSRFPIVLKPFREYGGKGIVKIEGNKAWQGQQEMSLDDFLHQIRYAPFEYLAVKYLRNVTQGDKRIIVVNGKIMGASLRLPADGSWICNVAMGGRSNYAEVDEEEIKIVASINPILSKQGIVMYGVDTLMGDNGKRVLSEINTTSIGGLPQIAKLTGQPLIEEAVDLIWKYIANKKALVSSM